MVYCSYQLQERNKMDNDVTLEGLLADPEALFEALMAAYSVGEVD